MEKRIIVVAIAMFCAVAGAAVSFADTSEGPSEVTSEKTRQETPQEGASAILNLLKERNYSDLFQQRYSEWHKVEAEGVKPEVAIKKLSAMWEKSHGMLVLVFEQLTKAEFELTKNEMPQKTETEDVASATVTVGEKKIPYSLYKMKNGLWGFHL